MSWDQIIIAVFGPMVIYFLGCHEVEKRRIGFTIGLCLEPVWAYTAIQNDQWGILLLATMYLLGHGRGLYKTFEKVTYDGYQTR